MSLDQDTIVRLLLFQRGKVIGYISSIVGDPHLAEDVFQEVAVVSLRKAGTLDHADLFPAWVFKTARYLALNAFRKRKRMPVSLDDSVLDLLDAQWLASDSSLDEPVEIDALRTCLDKLTGRSRRLVELRYGHNLAGQDLAQSLQQPLNTVYVALSRIYKALAKCIQTQLSSEGLSHG